MIRRMRQPTNLELLVYVGWRINGMQALIAYTHSTDPAERQELRRQMKEAAAHVSELEAGLEIEEDA